MTKYEFLEKAIKDQKYDGSIEALVLYAYTVGREQATREVSDNYTKVIEKITDKIEDDRFKKYMNEKIFGNIEEYNFYQNNKKFLYHSDYAQDIQATFSSDEIDETIYKKKG